MNKRLTLSPLMIAGFIAFLAAGELASGTPPYFVLMMIIAVFSACLTYNLLGGLGTISGIGFTVFAAYTLILSQTMKVVFFERADQNLDAPMVTMTVYAVFYFSLMLGTFTFARMRFALPRPAEPETDAQMDYLYFIALAGGLAGTFVVMALDLLGGAGEVSVTHGIARAIAYLLPFSLVIAVDRRIRSTNGRHCFSWAALWPTLAMVFQSFITTSRGTAMLPFAIIAVTGFVRGFHFGRRHLIAVGGLGLALFFFISPYLLWAREWRNTQPTIRLQFATMWRVLEAAPAQWATILQRADAEVAAHTGDRIYFSVPGAVTLNRLVLTAKDSSLINACAHGYHYGFAALSLDLEMQIPRFLDPNKPTFGSQEFLGHLDGQEPDALETTHTTLTSIPDSYGAFGWLGVAAFPFLVLPLIFVVYESMFDMTRPWGTVALTTVLGGIGAAPMGTVLSDTLIKEPIYLLIISACAAWGVGMIPARGDRSVQVAGGMSDRSSRAGSLLRAAGDRL